MQLSMPPEVALYNALKRGNEREIKLALFALAKELPLHEKEGILSNPSGAARRLRRAWKREKPSILEIKEFVLRVLMSKASLLKRKPICAPRRPLKTQPKAF